MSPGEPHGQRLRRGVPEGAGQDGAHRSRREEGPQVSDRPLPHGLPRRATQDHWPQPLRDDVWPEDEDQAPAEPAEEEGLGQGGGGQGQAQREEEAAEGNLRRQEEGQGEEADQGGQGPHPAAEDFGQVTLGP